MFRKVSEGAARRRGDQDQFQSVSLMLTPWNQLDCAARPPKTSRFASLRGVSPSSFIEESPKESAGEDAPSFGSQWRGRFKAAGRRDPRYDARARE